MPIFRERAPMDRRRALVARRAGAKAGARLAQWNAQYCATRFRLAICAGHRSNLDLRGVRLPPSSRDRDSPFSSGRHGDSSIDGVSISSADRFSTISERLRLGAVADADVEAISKKYCKAPLKEPQSRQMASSIRESCSSPRAARISCRRGAIAGTALGHCASLPRLAGAAAPQGR